MKLWSLHNPPLPRIWQTPGGHLTQPAGYCKGEPQCFNSVLNNTPWSLTSAIFQLCAILCISFFWNSNITYKWANSSHSGWSGVQCHTYWWAPKFWILKKSHNRRLWIKNPCHLPWTEDIEEAYVRTLRFWEKQYLIFTTLRQDRKISVEGTHKSLTRQGENRKKEMQHLWKVK